MERWDRSAFASSPDELEIEEAIRAVERLIHNRSISNATRASLAMALDAMRSDPRQVTAR
jgi:hypothetical protein